MKIATLTILGLWLLNSVDCQAAIGLLGKTSDLNKITAAQGNEIPGLMLRWLSLNPPQQPTESSSALWTVLTTNFSPITYQAVYKVLEFESPQHFFAAKQYVDAKVAEHIYKSYSDPELDGNGQPVPFNPSKPYVDFESTFTGFASLRSKVDTEFLAWINDPVASQDPTLDPESKVVPDASFRTLLNEKSEVNVGGTYFRVLPGGTVYFDPVSNAILGPTPPASVGPQSQCTNPVYSSKFTLHSSRKTGLFTSLHSYCQSNSPTTCQQLVFAHTRIYSADKNGVWSAQLGDVYASGSGYVSGLYSDDQFSDLANICLNKVPFNLDNKQYARGIYSVTHVTPVDSQSKIGWLNGKFFGLNNENPQFVRVWPLTA